MADAGPVSQRPVSQRPVSQRYVERPPVAALADVVSAVWVQEVAADAPALRHRNLPHGGAEIVCALGGIPRVLGPLTGPNVEVLAPGTTVVGVRLRPGAAGALLGLPPSELVDLAVPADALWGPAAARIGENVAAAGSAARSLATLQQAMVARRAAGGNPDALVAEAVRRLMPGRVTDVAALPGLLAASERNLRRRCLAAVGLGPKALHRTLRFQGFLARAQQALGAGRPPGTLVDLAVSAGYADQAHLTRECVRLTGVTPRAYLAETMDTCVCGHDHAASYGPLLAGSFKNDAPRQPERRPVADIDRELTALQGAIAGEVVLPGAPGYDTARRPAIARFHHIRPRAVVRCAAEQDVVEALAVARLLRAPLAVRGGGHCFAGRSSTTGLLLDVSPMDTVAIRGGVAVVGAGTRLGALYDALADHGLTLPAGCGPTVGIAGLTLGGGFGPLGRRHGLTCDRLVGARVVCGDGRVVDCDAHREPDIFWALRGGGGGGAVVTSLRFAPVPPPTTTTFHLAWPAAHAGPVVAAWTRWAPGAPDELTATLRIAAPADPGEPVTVELVGTMLDGDPTGLLDAFVRRAGTEPTTGALVSRSFREAKRSLEGTGGAELPGIRYVRSEFFRRPLPPDAAAALARSVLADRVPGHSHEVGLTPWGGAYNRVPPDATAFAHRAEAYLLEVGLVVCGRTAAAPARLERSWSTVAGFGTGRVYPNFPDPDRTLPAACYHGANHERLRRISAATDPDAVLPSHLEEPCPVHTPPSSCTCPCRSTGSSPGPTTARVRS